MIDLIGGLIFLALVVFFVGFGIFYAVIVFQAGWQLNRELVQKGVETDGEIIKREVKSPRNGLPLFFIFYRYCAPTAEGEKEFTKMEQVWFFEYPRYPLGKKVRVRYVPDNPETARRAEKVIGRRGSERRMT